MTKAIERRLVNGVWETVVVDENGGGGSLPDPSGEPDGDVLTVSSGIAVWSPGGGSLPDVDAASVGDFLEVSSTPSDNLTPTLAEIDAALSNDPNLGTGPRLAAGWQAEHDYAHDLNTQDGVQFLIPDGVLSVFAAEVNGGLTDVTEPDWSSAPNAGDSVSDDGVTWYNAGLASAFPPEPGIWQAETEYDLPAFVYPSTPNGHLYAMFPPGPLTSDVSEPTFPTDGSYASDGDGYWWDCGYVAAKEAAWQTLVRLLVRGLAGQVGDLLTLRQADSTPYAIEAFNDTYSETAAGLSIFVADDGTVTFGFAEGWELSNVLRFDNTVVNELLLDNISSLIIQVAANSMFSSKTDSAGGGAHAWIGPQERDKTMLAIQPHPADNKGLELIQDASQAADLLTILASNGTTVLNRVNKNGYLILKTNAAPADAELDANEAALWFDSTNGAAKLMVKAKQADGTVKTGSLNVQT